MKGRQAPEDQTEPPLPVAEFQFNQESEHLRGWWRLGGDKVKVLAADHEWVWYQIGFYNGRIILTLPRPCFEFLYRRAA